MNAITPSWRGNIRYDDAARHIITPRERADPSRRSSYMGYGPATPSLFGSEGGVSCFDSVGLGTASWSCASVSTYQESTHHHIRFLERLSRTAVCYSSLGGCSHRRKPCLENRSCAATCLLYHRHLLPGLTPSILRICNIGKEARVPKYERRTSGWKSRRRRYVFADPCADPNMKKYMAN